MSQTTSTQPRTAGDTKTGVLPHKVTHTLGRNRRLQALLPGSRASTTAAGPSALTANITLNPKDRDRSGVASNAPTAPLAEFQTGEHTNPSTAIRTRRAARAATCPGAGELNHCNYAEINNLTGGQRRSLRHHLMMWRLQIPRSSLFVLQQTSETRL